MFHPQPVSLYNQPSSPVTSMLSHPEPEPEEASPSSSNHIPKTMDDIWHEINLSSSSSSSKNILLQDLLNLDTPPSYLHFLHSSHPHDSQPFTNFKNTNDPRSRRMLKNRESAARSRARKQAYTNQLEKEVSNLMEENARLRRQEEERLRVDHSYGKRKRRLHRTYTAPF